MHCIVHTASSSLPQSKTPDLSLEVWSYILCHSSKDINIKFSGFRGHVDFRLSAKSDSFGKTYFDPAVVENFVFIARCTLVQSAVLRSHVIRPSVCLSVCDDQVPWSHRLEFFENNFTAELLGLCSRADPNMGHLVQREHPQNWGGIRVGSLGSAKNLQYLRNGAR